MPYTIRYIATEIDKYTEAKMGVWFKLLSPDSDEKYIRVYDGKVDLYCSEELEVKLEDNLDLKADINIDQQKYYDLVLSWMSDHLVCSR